MDKEKEEIKEAKVVKEKEDSKEEKKEKTKNNKPKKKKERKDRGLYFVVLLFIIIIFVALIIGLNNVGLLKLGQLDNLNPKKKVELNYTTPNNSQKEGVYITDVSEVVEEVMPSIVAITSKTLVTSGRYGPSFFSQEQYTEGAGSGIIISQSDSELLILTNNHVVEGTDTLSVQFVDEKSVDATVKGTSERKDVAIVSVKLSNIDSDTLEKIKIATIGDSDELKVGNGIIAIGNALGYGQAVTTGVVSAINREVSIDGIKNKMIQIDAAINGGNSGGALLNSRGEVVGINSAKYSSSGYSSEASIEGMGFAIPITDVKDLIETLINGEEEPESGTIGIEGVIITQSQSTSLNVPIGFYVSKVVEGSGAEQAGIEMGNIITKIDGEAVEELADIQNVLYNKRKGDTVILTVSYQNKNKYDEKEVEVTLS